MITLEVPYYPARSRLRHVIVAILMAMTGPIADTPRTREPTRLEWTGLSFLYWFVFMGALAPGNISHDLADGVYGDTVRNLLLCMGVPSPWGAPPMARFARVVVPGLPHNKPRYRG
jgi:hypothetical protein